MLSAQTNSLGRCCGGETDDGLAAMAVSGHVIPQV